jgi:putative phosphoribosyl transferase
MSFFLDRKDAGKRLAGKIQKVSSNTIILALARGGVPVAYEISKKLGIAMDVLIVRKIGAPGKEELGIGAIAEGGVRVFDLLLIEQLGIPTEMIVPLLKMEEQELYRRVHHYRNNTPLVLRDKTVILVDDGIATGISVLAAIRAIKKHKIKKVIVATPVSATDALEMLHYEADRIISLVKASYFPAVGAWYESFPQLSDEDVVHILERRKSNKNKEHTASHKYHS